MDRGNAIAGIARRLHDLDVTSCPFDRTLRVTVPEAVANAARGEVDLDADRAGWSAADLVTAVQQTQPADEDLAVCHGDLSLPNVVIDPRTMTVTGPVDLARTGIADTRVGGPKLCPVDRRQTCDDAR